jgi:hypothetical protein
MAERRNRRRKRVLTYCSVCAARLWRINSDRHYLFANSSAEIRQLSGMTRKKAAMFTQQSNTFVDRHRWLEEFFCTDHGPLWLLLEQDADGSINTSVPDPKIWEQTTGTIDPRKPNPSVSEFTFRMSRRAAPNLGQRYYD